MISVILCTHNPRADFLGRTLDSLKAQTLDQSTWELVLVDNGSKEPVADKIDLRWHPDARIVREDELGLTPARLRGIRESRGDLLVFVDDDNILQSDYLAVAAEIAETHPTLGAWGGDCEGEFEEAPPAWAAPYLCYLAIRRVDKFVRTKEYRYEYVPVGAGMCIRRVIAERYAVAIKSNPLRRELDRKGTSLASGGDSDLVFTAIDAGLDIGLSPRLSLRHLMPKGRLELHYLERLMEGIAASAPIVLHLHGVKVTPPTRPLFERWLAAYRMWRQPAPVRRLEAARARGLKKAHAQLTALG